MDTTTTQDAGKAATVAKEAEKAIAAALDAARTLSEKGDGVLTRVGTVWTYPGCPIDNSGTNLRLPIDYVPDAVVRAALVTGELVGTVRDFGNGVTAVRFAVEGEDPIVITLGQAGTSEAGTELPLNSRPTHDAAKAPPAAPPETLAAADEAGRKAAAAGKAKPFA